MGQENIQERIKFTINIFAKRINCVIKINAFQKISDEKKTLVYYPNSTNYCTSRLQPLISALSNLPSTSKL